MKFSELSKYLEKLEKTSSRLEITEILADLFNKSTKEEIDKTTYLLLGRLAPSYKNIVFNLAERMMQVAISNAYEMELARVKKIYKQTGDLGDTVIKIAKAQSSKLKAQKLSVHEVFQRLLKIAQDEGEGSQERKITDTAKLLANLDPLSAKYVARIPVGKLRLGFSDKTILDALSWMKHGDKSAKVELERAYNVLPDVGKLAQSVKKVGIKKASRDVVPVVGVPILPMLAQRLKSPTEMIEKMEEVAVEPKFDGLRIQIHYRKGNRHPERSRKGGRVEGSHISEILPESSSVQNDKEGFIKAFTRNMNETSWMFPELKEIGKYIKARRVVLDTEAMGVDEKRKTLANFQTTMTRRRKHEIEDIAKKISIKFYVFDILHKDGKNLMDKPYIERRKELEKVLKKGELLEIVDYKITKDSKVIEEMMRRELKEGLEGVIVKRANSRYVAGRTGWRWVKMKEGEDAKAKLADTLDCIVMGYNRGRGKRAGFGLGGFLVGVMGKEKILTFTKIGTGLTDNQFKELKKRLSDLEIKEKPKEYGKVEKILIPDVWVEPKLVVEIAADEITKSPSHSSGYALRFPRLVKFRDDKSAKQATTVKEIKKLFRLQNT